MGPFERRPWRGGENGLRLTGPCTAFIRAISCTPMPNTLTIRLPDHEAELLAAYARKTGRTRTDIMRSYIRSLEPAYRAVSIAKNRPARRRKT